MPKQTELNGAPEGSAKAVATCLSAARKAKNGKLAGRMRVPACQSWDAKVAKGVKEAFLETVQKARPDGKPTELDVLLSNSVYFAACGLSIGYAHLGVAGWIDEVKHAFHPVVTDCLKLQREILDCYRLAGLDKAPGPEDIGAILYGPGSRLLPAARNGTGNGQPVAPADAGRVLEPTNGHVGTEADPMRPGAISEASPEENRS